MNTYFDKIRNSVDAIIVVDNHILVCNMEDNSYTYLPGGGIEVGESMPKALIREMREELQKEIVIQKYIGYIDQRFELDKRYIHEISHIFQVDLVGVTNTNQLEAYAEVPSVSWVSVDKLEEVNIKPDILKIKIPALLNQKEMEIWQISQNEIKSDKSV